MSRNGSGVYSLPAGNPVVTGTTISSTWANNTLSDMATALTGSVASDGQTPMTGNLQMGNNKITGLANGTNAQDAVTYSQLTGLAPATSGSSVLAGNGAGGFTNVTLATGLTYSGGTLTANINTLLPDQSGKSGYVLTTNGSVTSWGTAGGNGTVTSVDVSGGTTGLTVSGGPITSSGTMTMAGTLAITSGGTGATSATGALTNLLPSQASQSGKFLTTNGTSTSWASAGTGTVTSVAMSVPSFLSVSGSPITSSGTLAVGLSGVALPVANGGTGATSAAAAVTSLGAVSASANQTITGNKSFSGNTGFGASNPSTAWPLFSKTTTTDPSAIFEANSSSGTVNVGTINKVAGSAIGFFYGTTVPLSYTQVGAVNVTSTGTTYDTGSDYRLKDNPTPMTGSWSKVKSLKPVTYTWKVNGEQGEGFIAHELQEVVPLAVNGVKDAVDDNGNPKYQSIDYSRIVPVLTAALQEAIARIEVLEAKLGA